MMQSPLDDLRAESDDSVPDLLKPGSVLCRLQVQTRRLQGSLSARHGGEHRRARFSTRVSETVIVQIAPHVRESQAVLRDGERDLDRTAKRRLLLHHACFSQTPEFIERRGV